MKFHAKNNDLIIKESERLISGSVNIYTCEFTFDESWDGYTVTAVFSTNGSRLINMAVVDGKCQIPVEVLRPNARIRVGIFGTDGVRSRPTTYSDWVTVEQGVDMTGNTAQPPTPSVYEQWMSGLTEKNEEWEANEQARVEAENARSEAENERAEAEQAREDLERGYVAQAQAAAEEAESWARQASEVVGGDFATETEAKAMADAAESNANAYTDQKISEIPTPDVSGQIGEHNADGTAHPEIRQKFSQVIGEAVANAKTYTDQKIAENPAPDAYTKTETLNDATKAMFGLGADAVPDDVLRVLSRFQNGLGNEYVWEKITYGTKYVVAEDGTTTAYILYAYANSGTNTIQYSKTIATNENGLVLVDPVSVTISRGDYSAINSPALAGCYVKVNNEKTGNVDTFYKFPSTYSISEASEGSYRVLTTNATKVVAQAVPAEIVVGYVNSHDPNAYPVDDGYTYVPLGQLGSKVQIATGSYTGTGTYGESNPNSLTFDFEPKFVIVATENGTQGHAFVFDMSQSLGLGGYYSKHCAANWNANTLTWYSTSDANVQSNTSGKQFKYIAIG